ncbi:MAG: hypothetical protein QM831_07060 [Kofleriaceae bacterium]
MTPVITRGDGELKILALHGRNLGAPSMVELADRFGVGTFVIPEADDRSWYPASFLAPVEQNAERLAQALARVDELVTTYRPDVVLGFSQGACLALEWLSRTRSPLDVIAFTGGLIGPVGTVWPERLIGHQAFLSTSDIDEWVPIARVRESVEVLRKRSVLVEFHVLEGRDHSVDDRELALAKSWLAHR